MRSPLLRVCGLLALLGGIASRPVAAQSCLCGTAADEFEAARIGLTREWVVQVPFDSSAWRLEQVVVGENLVVAEGGDGTMAAVVRRSTPGGPRPGTVAWSRRIEGGGAPIEPAGIGATLVTFARGKSITAVDARSGNVLWERPLRTVASAAAVPAGGWVYAPLDAGGISRLPEDPWAVNPAAAEAGTQDDAAETGPRPGERLDPVELSSDGEVDVPPVPFAGGVLWCTTGGRIGAIVRTPQASQRLAFDLGSPASGPPVVHDGDVFVATRAGDIARLARSPRGLTANAGVIKDESGAEIAFRGWHTIIAAVPEGSPVVGSQALVVCLGPSGIAAFATSTGDLLWQVPTVGRPLAIIGDRVWCLEETGFLVARDLATGSRRGRLCLGCFTLPVTNPAGDRLVLASPGGLVVSLAPRRTVAAEPPVPQPPAAADKGAPAPAAEAGGDAATP
jgi:hypothetical protein